MMSTPWVTRARLRLPLDERILVVHHPADLTHRAVDAPGWWRIREQALREMREGRLVELVTGPEDVIDVEVTDEPSRELPLKSQRLCLVARHGRVFVGPPSSLPSCAARAGDSESAGRWIELQNGRYAVETERLHGGLLRLRLYPAADTPLVRGIPDLGPTPRRWDSHVVRSAEVDQLLDKFTRAQSETQREFRRRVAGHDAYELDQDRGELQLSTSGAPILVSPVDVIGTYGFLSGSFRWAWSNGSVSPTLRQRVARVRELGLERDVEWLVEPELPILPDDAFRLAALATRVMERAAWYAVGYDSGMLLVAVPEEALGAAPTIGPTPLN